MRNRRIFRGGNVRGAEELLHEHVHSSGHFGQEEKLAQVVECGVAVTGPLDAPARAEIGWGRAVGSGVASLLDHRGAADGDEDRG